MKRSKLSARIYKKWSEYLIFIEDLKGNTVDIISVRDLKIVDATPEEAEADFSFKEEVYEEV